MKKSTIIKASFIIAFIFYIFSCLSCTTDGVEFTSFIIALVSAGYMSLVAVANRGNWIFK